MDLSGDLLFTWSSYVNPASAQWNVYGRQFNNNGIALGSEFQVNTSVGYNQMHANVAMNNQGQVVVDWAGGSTQDSAGIYLQRFTISFVGLNATSGDTFDAKGGKIAAHARGELHTASHLRHGRSLGASEGHFSHSVQVEIHATSRWSDAAFRFHFPGRARRGHRTGHAPGASTDSLPPA
jgi:hypothetical protein